MILTADESHQMTSNKSAITDDVSKTVNESMTSLVSTDTPASQSVHSIINSMMPQTTTAADAGNSTPTLSPYPSNGLTTIPSVTTTLKAAEVDKAQTFTTILSQHLTSTSTMSEMTLSPSKTTGSSVTSSGEYRSK